MALKWVTSGYFTPINGVTHLKFNLAPEKLPSQNDEIVFQPSFFRGKVLNFGSVCASHLLGCFAGT